MKTTHRFRITHHQLKTILAEKFSIPSIDEMTVVTVDEGDEGDEGDDNWSLLDELEVGFSASFKDAGKVARRVERFKVKEADGEVQSS